MDAAVGQHDLDAPNVSAARRGVRVANVRRAINRAGTRHIFTGKIGAAGAPVLVVGVGAIGRHLG